MMRDFTQKKLVTTGVVNRRLGLGFYVQQDTRVMPFLHHWKTNIAGAYAVGLEPANCHCEGRVREQEVYRTLRAIQPFERIKVELTLGILEETRPWTGLKRSLRKEDDRHGEADRPDFDLRARRALGAGGC